MMRLRKKILLSLSVIILVFLLSLCGGILYLYYRPASVKPFIEKTISGSTGTIFTIETLSYSFKPLQIRAEGVLLESNEGPGGFTLAIPNLIADLALKGPFGQKTLVLENLKIDGFSFDLSEKADMPTFNLKGTGRGLISRTLKSAVGLFLLRDIKFEAAEIKGGQISAKLKDQRLEVRDMEAYLGGDRPMEILGNTHFRWPSAQVEFIAPGLRLTTDTTIAFDDPMVKGTISVPNANLLNPHSIVKSVDGKADFVYSNKQKSLALEPDLFFRELVFKQDTKSPLNNPFDLRINADVLLKFGERKVESRRLMILVNDTFYLNGEAGALLGSEKVVRFRILHGHILPQKLLALIPDHVKGKWPHATLIEPVNLRGHMEGNHSTEWAWYYDLEAQLKANPFDYVSKSFSLKTRLTGSLQAEGKIPDTNLLIKMKGDKTLFSHKMVQTRPFSWDLSMTGKHPFYIIEQLNADVPEVKPLIGGKEIPIEAMRLDIQEGTLDSKKKVLTLPEIRLQTNLLKNLHAFLETDGKKVLVELEGEDTQFVKAAKRLNLSPKGWQLKGHDSIGVNMMLNEEGDLSFTSKFDFRAFDFQNSDGSFLGEKLNIHGDIIGSLDQTRSHVSSNMTLQFTGGEILYDNFYFDLNKNALSAAYEGDYDVERKSLQLSELNLQLKDLIAISTQGTMNHQKETPDIRLSINIPKTPLNPVFQHFVKEPFKTRNPILASLGFRGAFSADLSFAGHGADRRVKGHTMWHGGEFVSEQHGLSFKGIELDLPLWYETLPSKADGKNLEGKLSIQSMILPMLPDQPLKMPLNAGPNRLIVKSPTMLRAEAGRIQWGPMTFSRLFSTSPTLETSLTLSGLELDSFLSDVWSRSIQGTLNGTLAPIHFDGKNFTSKGKLKMNVFGGDMVFTDLGASGLFSSTPLLKLNAWVNDLHLDLLTRDTSFGRIEGILKGRILDLEVAQKQPQKFDLLLETVKRKGVNQKISVMAVDNIARIGGGQSPFMGFAGVITSFFKEFPYQKIGVHATLENDIFRIHGTIKEEGKEFLVKRGGLSGVNVINQNPDNRIRFQDMVKRVKRITSGKGGPVIK